MDWLIDGYNLIHAAHILGRGVGPRSLEQSRQALLDFLVASIDPPELSRTTVVFDAEHAPPGLPREFRYEGIRVLFARAGQEGADALIEELVVAHSAPRQLTVVSSDHRLHRAARKRRAQAIDSDRWYAEMLARRAARGRSHAPAGPEKPAAPLLPDQVAYWLREMIGEEPAPPPQPGAPSPPPTGGNPPPAVAIEPTAPPRRAKQEKPKQEKPKQAKPRPDKPRHRRAGPVPDVDLDLDSPFPPGYAEEL